MLEIYFISLLFFVWDYNIKEGKIMEIFLDNIEVD